MTLTLKTWADNCAPTDPGIYFGLNYDTYDAIPYLRNSDIAALRDCPPDFYYSCKWLNPNPQLFDGDDKKDQKHFVLGHAYHTRIAEGSQAFFNQYAMPFEPAKGSLVTSDDIKTFLKSNGLPISGNKPELIMRALQYFPNLPIYDYNKQQYEQYHQGKQFLKRNDFERVDFCGSMIEAHPTQGKMFKGGAPEVVIIWFSERYQTMFKARFDYLKVNAIIDLKSFELKGSGDIDGYVHRAVNTYGYLSQMLLYLDASQYIKGLVQQGKVFGDHDPNFVKGLGMVTERAFVMAFIKKTKAPILHTKVLQPDTNAYMAGGQMIQKAVDNFKSYYETFGKDMWLWVADITPFEDDKFPQSMWYGI
jgi:hypothetical protein